MCCVLCVCMLLFSVSLHYWLLVFSYCRLGVGSKVLGRGSWVLVVVCCVVVLVVV